MRDAEPPTSPVLAAIDRVANRPGIVMGGAFIAVLIISTLWMLSAGIPQPTIHDEFAYLLQADAFAHGRLSNPQHPMWEHFETFHELMQPTYQAKYQPAQGMLLCIGQLLTGEPIVGAWIGVAAACAATVWMFYAFLPPRWAMLGALLIAGHPLVLWWAETYWGGAAAMIGGALIIGGLARLRNSTLASALMGLGLVMLLLSRPFEGAVLVIASVALLPGVWPIRIKALLPAAVITAIGLAFLGYYNFRVTGNAFRLPYQEYESQYEITTPFLWLPPHATPDYRHAEFREWFANEQFGFYQRQRTLGGFAHEMWHEKLPKLAELLPSRAIWILVLALPIVMRQKISRRLAIICIIGFIALGSEILIWPHYAAMFLPVVMLMILFVLHRIARTTAGRWIVATVVVGWIASTVAVSILRARTEPGFSARRAEVIGQLNAAGGTHLVIVRYLPGHQVDFEWVFNAADIDGSAIVWARDMGDVKNRELVDYFKGRSVWLMQVSRDAFRVNPYPGSPSN